MRGMGKVTSTVRFFTPRNRVQAAVLGALVAGAVVFGGVSIASIPDSGGLIHGCYTNTTPHNLRVIDTSKTPTCPKGTSALTWYQSGQAQHLIYTTTGTTSSSYMFTAPLGVTKVEIELWSGGGGGAGGYGGICNVPGNDGVPGGYGGYLRSVVPVTPGQSYSVSVGGGGLGGPGGQGTTSCSGNPPPGGPGGPGGTSAFGPLVASTGGGGGDNTIGSSRDGQPIVTPPAVVIERSYLCETCIPGFYGGGPGHPGTGGTGGARTANGQPGNPGVAGMVIVMLAGP
jgi:hypothetical protein